MSFRDVPGSTGENTQVMNNMGNPVFSCPTNINSVGMTQTSTLTASEGVLAFVILHNLAH